MTKLSQTQRLFNLLADNKAHRTDEIVRVVYPASNICSHCGRGDFKNLARVGARINDLVNGKWPGKTKCVIRGWKETAGKFYWYRMEEPRRARQFEVDAFLAEADEVGRILAKRDDWDDLENTREKRTATSIPQHVEKSPTQQARLL